MARGTGAGVWLLALLFAPAAALRVGGLQGTRMRRGAVLAAAKEQLPTLAPPPRETEDTERGLSPGYGIPPRPAAALRPAVRIGVRQNLAAVYGDLQDLDRAARHAFTTGLLLGVRNADDISASFTNKGLDLEVTSQMEVTTSVEECETATATVRSVGGGLGDGFAPEQREATTTTTKRVRRTETQVRSKILRTGKRSVADRMEKVGDAVLPLWMSVGHSSEVPRMKTKFVKVGGVPIVLWRDASNRLAALSDVCMHRGASLARGWVAPSGCVACPYHGFEFERSGELVRTPTVMGLPGDGGPSEETVARMTAPPPTTVSYPVREEAGWIQVFPRSTPEAFGALHAQEAVSEPLDYPELRDPRFRAIEGGCDIAGSIDAVMENVLDLLHISYVHLFGNGQEPLPIHSDYFTSYDDPHPNRRILKSGKVAFTYNAGSKAWSKVVGGQQVVQVENEFHLPYTMIIRVRFGKSTKTIVASATPIDAGNTRLNYKLYRDFALTHARDEGPINQLLDRLFVFLMDLTLEEDKVIVESLYEHARQGYMNGKYDKHQLTYRRAVQEFLNAIGERDQLIRANAFDDVAIGDLATQDELL